SSFQCITHCAHLFPCRVHVNRAIVEGHHVFSTGFQSGFHDCIFVAFLEGDHAFFAEQVSHGAVSTQVTTGFGEGMTHFCHGAVTVVRQTLNHHRRTARTVTFINDGFHVRVVIATHATRN